MASMSQAARSFCSKTRARVLASAVLLCVSVPGLGAVPVFPGAVGFGTQTPAGRGGTVIKVTNLNESGPGSLKACIEASGPRVCVFEVSGVISWTSEVRLYNPNITIAGQTAPSPGIMIRGGFLNILTQDVLIQHITHRAGDDLIPAVTKERDAFQMSYWSGTANNVVIDHCTLSWGTDETIDIWHGYADVTVSNTIISEGLTKSPIFETGGYGMLIGPVANGRVSAINNLFASNKERNPFSLVGEFVMVNNVVYNWAADGLRFSNQPDPGLLGDLILTKNTVIGNLFIRGPSYRAFGYGSSKPIWFDGKMLGSGNQAYFSDNAEVANTADTPVPPSDPWALVSISSPNTRSSLEVKSPPTWPAGLTARPVDTIKAAVLASAGSRPGDRSKKDAQIIADVKNGTGSWVSCVNPSSYYKDPAYIAENVVYCDQRNAGGWPVYAENRRTLTLPANPNGDDDGDGYTNLEEWLHMLAAEVEGREQSAVPAPPAGLVAQ